MKDKEILPMGDTLTAAWPENNFLNSIVQCCDTGYDWIMNTHIQIYGSYYKNQKYNISERRLTFYPFGTLRANIYDLCPFIRKYVVPRGYIKEYYNDFTDYIIETINKGLYINTVVREVFRNDMQINHPCYFFGYDTKKREIWIADNLENGKYYIKQVPFSEINTSFKISQKDEWSTSIFLYQLVEYKYKDNIEFMCDQIEDYIYSGKGMCYLNRFFCPSTKYENEEDEGEVFLGCDAYKVLFDEIDDTENEAILDVRSFSFLLDHKKIMYLREKYCIEKGILRRSWKYNSEIKEILSKSSVILNMVIKYNITKNRSELLGIKQYLEKLIILDSSYMNKLLSEIKNCSHN